MRHEFSAIVAAGMLKRWTLSKLAERWCCGRRIAKRVIADWVRQADEHGWDEAVRDDADPKSVASVHAFHGWLAPMVPQDANEMPRGCPDEAEAAAASQKSGAPAVPPGCPDGAPLAGASPIGDVDEDVDLSVPTPAEKQGPAAEVFGFWKAWHPAARKLSAGDRTKINGRLRDSSLDDVRLVIRWAHEAGDADWFQGENPRGKKYLGLGTLLKTENYSDRLGDALAWQGRGYQDVAGAAAPGNADEVATRAWSRLKQHAQSKETAPGKTWHFSDKDPSWDAVVAEAVAKVWGSWSSMAYDKSFDFKGREFRQAFTETNSRRAAS
mgnify:FL=1